MFLQNTVNLGFYRLGLQQSEADSLALKTPNCHLVCFMSHQAVGVTCSADALRPGEYPGVGRHRCFPFHQQISEISSCQKPPSAWGFYHLALLHKNFYLNCWRRCMFFPCFVLFHQVHDHVDHRKFHVTWSRKQRFHNDKFSFVLLCGRTTQELESSSHNNIFEMLQVSLHPCRKVFSSGSRMLIKKNTVL